MAPVAVKPRRFSPTVPCVPNASATYSAEIVALVPFVNVNPSTVIDCPAVIALNVTVDSSVVGARSSPCTIVGSAVGAAPAVAAITISATTAGVLLVKTASAPDVQELVKLANGVAPVAVKPRRFSPTVPYVPNACATYAAEIVAPELFVNVKPSTVMESPSLIALNVIVDSSVVSATPATVTGVAVGGTPAAVI